jgi:glutamate-1-semialdehyde aminotransferase
MGGNAEKNRLHIHLMHRGIATMSARIFIFSCVHTEKDVDQTVKALSDSFEAMLAEGTLKKA